MQIWDRDEQIDLGIPALGPLHALAWSPNGPELLLGGIKQARLSLYEALGGHKADIALWRSSGPTGVHSVAYAPGGRYAVAGCTDGTVQVVDVVAREHVHSYHGHTGPVRSVAWSPDGKHILSGGEDSHAFVWAVPATM